VAGTLVGSLQLARALGDNAEGRAVLSAARKALMHQYDVLDDPTTDISLQKVANFRRVRRKI